MGVISLLSSNCLLSLQNKDVIYCSFDRQPGCTTGTSIHRFAGFSSEGHNILIKVVLLDFCNAKYMFLLFVRFAIEGKHFLSYCETKEQTMDL